MPDRQYLSLTLGTLSVTIYTFLNESYPRILYQAPSRQYTQWKTLVKQGLPFEPPNIWSVNALVTPDEAITIQQIYQEHLRLDRIDADSKITVIDTTWQHSERAPRTRAIAPSPFNTTTLFGSDNAYIRYYAQFYAVFSTEPKFTQTGDMVTVTFSLTETEEKVTP